MFCNKCTLQFDKKYVFDLHLLLVHGEKMAEVKIEPLISKENFQECQASEPVFPDHVVETDLKCNICSSLFKTKQGLKSHIASVHDGKKSFKCNVCDASFARRDKLNRHVASVHNGKKPFECNICDTNFKEKGSLKKHVASVHEGKKPFKCNICETSFTVYTSDELEQTHFFNS